MVVVEWVLMAPPLFLLTILMGNDFLPFPTIGGPLNQDGKLNFYPNIFNYDRTGKHWDALYKMPDAEVEQNPEDPWIGETSAYRHSGPGGSDFGYLEEGEAQLLDGKVASKIARRGERSSKVSGPKSKLRLSFDIPDCVTVCLDHIDMSSVDVPCKNTDLACIINKATPEELRATLAPAALCTLHACLDSKISLLMEATDEEGDDESGAADGKGDKKKNSDKEVKNNEDKEVKKDDDKKVKKGRDNKLKKDEDNKVKNNQEEVERDENEGEKEEEDWNLWTPLNTVKYYFNEEAKDETENGSSKKDRRGIEKAYTRIHHEGDHDYISSPIEDGHSPKPSYNSESKQHAYWSCRYVYGKHTGDQGNHVEKQDDQSLEGQSLNSQSLGDHSISEQVFDGQSPDDQIFDSQNLGDHSISDQVFDSQNLGDQSLDDHSLKDQSLDNQNLNNQSLGGQIFDGQSLDDHSLKDQSLNNQNLGDQSLEDQSLDQGEYRDDEYHKNEALTQKHQDDQHRTGNCSENSQGKQCDNKSPASDYEQIEKLKHFANLDSLRKIPACVNTCINNLIREEAPECELNNAIGECICKHEHSASYIRDCCTFYEANANTGREIGEIFGDACIVGMASLREAGVASS